MDTGSARHVRLKLYDDAKLLLSQLKSNDISSELPRTTAAQRRRPTLTGCKKLLAKKYFEDYKDCFDSLDHLDSFADYNYGSGAWSRDFNKAWRRSVHKKQIAALIEAESSGVSLKKCAGKYGVNFDGFHFSSILYMAIFPRTISLKNFAHPNLIDFSEISANGSFIDKIWVGTIASFSMCQLKQAKFYTSTSEGCFPGTNTYQMDFTGANLSEADLRFSYLRGCNFTNTVLTGTDFRDANLLECCFSGAEGTYISTAEGNEGVERLRYLIATGHDGHLR